MHTISRILFIILLIGLGAILFRKGLELWNEITWVDGDGIGISFLGLEINDHVSAWHVRYYAAGLLVAGLTAFIAAVSQLGKSYVEYYR